MMAFVKWGVELKPTELVTTNLSVDGIPISQYLDMRHEAKNVIALVEKLLTCCDEERDAALIQEAHALLARIKGKEI